MKAMIMKMITKPMVKMLAQAYEQGKDDHIKGEFDLKEFKKQAKQLIKSQF